MTTAPALAVSEGPFDGAQHDLVRDAAWASLTGALSGGVEQDHGKANDELVQLANAKFVATDAKPGLVQRREPPVASKGCGVRPRLHAAHGRGAPQRRGQVRQGLA
jgi:hypothetical protein